MRYSVWLTLTVLMMAAMEFCVFHPATGQSPSAADVRQFGAKGDGETDDTAAIQRAVDSSRGGVWLPRGEYRITAAITIDLDRVGPASIAGDGTGRLVMAGPGPAIRFLGTHQGSAAPATFLPNVWQRQRMPVVDNLEIIGAHDEAVGIEASGTMQLTVTRVNIRRALHAIHLVDRNRNVIISECHLYENDGVGLYLDDVNLHQINVAGCHISYNRGGGIVSRSGNVRNLHITGCDIEANMGEQSPPTANVLIDCTGGEHGTAEIAITGCTIQHSANYGGGAEEKTVAPGGANIRLLGKEIWPIDSVAITGNVISDTTISVEIDRSMDVTLSGNTFFAPKPDHLVVTRSQRVTVTGNTFNPRQFDRPGALRFTDCRDCLVTGSSIHDARSTDGALILENCEGFVIDGLNLTDCARGIVVKNSRDCIISNCRVARTDEGGTDIEIDSQSRDIVLGGNRFNGLQKIAPEAVITP